MARTKIAVADRPELHWFRLDAYRPSRTMSFRQWGQQILKRAMLREAFLQKTASNEQSIASQFAAAALADAMEALKTDPLRPFVPNSGGAPLLEMSVKDFQDISSQIDRYNQIAASLGKQSVAKDIPIDQAIGLQGNFLGHLRINLAARDAEITDAVAKWLNVRRRYFGSKLHKKPLRVSAINEWLDSNMLAFTDLHLWSLWADDEITQEQMIYLLFPDIEATCDREKGPDFRGKFSSIKEKFEQYVTMSNGNALLYGTED